MADEIDNEIDSLFENSPEERKKRKSDIDYESVSSRPQPEKDTGGTDYRHGDQGGFFGSVGKAFEEAKEKVAPSKETRERNIESAVYETKGESMFTDDGFEIADLKKEPILRAGATEKDIAAAEKASKELVFTGTYTPEKSLSQNILEGRVKRKQDIQDAKWSYVGEQLNPVKSISDISGAVGGLPGGVIAAKGAMSEAKLKWEASKYGITPEMFENAKKQNRLDEVKDVIFSGKTKEAGLKHAQTLDEKTRAETAALKAQAAQRYAKAEQMSSPEVPKGGRRLVQFGSTDFGQTPLYMNARGTHSQMRSQFIPGKASGVSNSLAASKLEIARMKQRVLSGPSEGGVNAVQLLQPKPNIAGLPSTVARLAASSPRANPVSKLSPTSTYRPGPSILDKLSANKRKPWQ